ncbi:MAG: fumarate hydratase [Methanoregulaceae archaeon]|jgi:fumarate hydratase subunit alpha
MMVYPAGEQLFRAVAEATCRAFRQAATTLPPDVVSALQRARDAETSAIARSELGTILENVALAEKTALPLCQDTGVPVVYLTIPPRVPYTEDLLRAVSKGVEQATRIVPLRPNVVSPCTRHNTGDNCGPGMPAVHVRPGERFTVTALPKGAGAENMSRQAVLLPTGKDRIPEFVAETMLIAGGRPCPPVVLGVGIGSTFDGSAALAKEALLLPIDAMDPFEQELCDAVNALGIGPMGLGGKTTALAVKVKTAACHTASLPVAVNVQCWAARRATVEVTW